MSFTISKAKREVGEGRDLGTPRIFQNKPKQLFKKKSRSKCVGEKSFQGERPRNFKFW